MAEFTNNTENKSSAVPGRLKDPLPEMSTRLYGVLTAVLFVLFAFLLFYRVTEIPIPYNVDEAGMAYDAVSLVNYHCDRYLYRFPVYFVNFGGGQNALYTYLAAVLIRLFGYSVLIVRLPAILLSLISALVFTLMIRREYGNTASVLAAAFFCTLPFSIMHSRWGLESYLLFPMLIISLAAFSRAAETSKTGWFFLSGVLFGLTLYSYTVSYLLLPVFLGGLLIRLLAVHRLSGKNFLAFAIPLVLMAVPLVLMLAVNSGMIDEIRTRFFSVPRFLLFRAGEISPRHILTHLKPDGKNIFYNLFVNDYCAYNIIPKFGSMYYLTIPVMIYGFIRSLRGIGKSRTGKAFSPDPVMVWLFFVTFVQCLMFEGINANRGCAVFVPLIYFCVAGLHGILKKSRIIFVGFCAVYLVIFGLFLNHYFRKFPETVGKDSMFASAADISDALEFAEERVSENGMIYVLDSVQPHIYVLLAKQVDPYTFMQQRILANDYFVKIFDRYRFRFDAVVPDCAYILNTLNEIPEEFRTSPLETKQFNTVTVYYPGEE